MTISGHNGYHCINCGCYLCYPPNGSEPTLEDLHKELEKAKKEAQSNASRYLNYIQELEHKITP